MRCDARDAMRGPMRCELVAMQCAALRAGCDAMRCAALHGARIVCDAIRCARAGCIRAVQAVPCFLAMLKTKGFIEPKGSKRDF
jgi:hypothetical protein